MLILASFKIHPVAHGAIIEWSQQIQKWVANKVRASIIPSAISVKPSILVFLPTLATTFAIGDCKLRIELERNYLSEVSQHSKRFSSLCYLRFKVVDRSWDERGRWLQQQWWHIINGTFKYPLFRHCVRLTSFCLPKDRTTRSSKAFKHGANFLWRFWRRP